MVKIRSRTHRHSIRAIKDGSIKNVVARGKSKLKFRLLVDVYNQGNTKDDVPIPRVVRDLENDSEMTQGGSRTFGAEVNTGTDPEDFNMTLDQIRKQSKVKKRKRRDTETASQVKVKQKYSTLQTEDEGCNVEEEPISSWNTKCSKRRKKKQERKTKCGSTSSPSAKKVGLPVFCDVKPEASWDDMVPEAMGFIPIDPLLDSDKEPESMELVEEIMHDFPTDTRLALYCSPEPNSPGMVDIEEPVTTILVDEAFEDASEEFIDERKARCCLVDNLALENHENVLCCSVSREEAELEVQQISESEKIGSPRMVDIEEPITTILVDEAFEDASEEFIDERKVQCCLVDNRALENQENVVCSIVSIEEAELEVQQISESENIGCVKSLISSNTSSVCKEDKADEESTDSKPNLDMTITSLEIVEIEAPEILATDISGSLTMDLGVENTELWRENEDIAKDELPEATDILQLTSCCDSLDNLHLVPDDSTVSLEEDHVSERLQQSSPSGNVDEAGDHKSSQLFQTPPDEAEETDSIQQQELHLQPEKLLSGRKVLSPTSQAKLRKAMEHPDSPEKRCKKTKVKLYFSSQTSHRILKAQGLDSIDRVEVIPNPKQAIRKANNNTQQTQFQRATHKFPHRDTQAAKPQPFSTGGTSLQGCTQKAIDFSKGQMRDFQYVADKLTKELKSMRQITKRCLLAESSPSIMSECNLDEVKTLIGNAEKAEKSSKKWLSIIERDCNRFCKLMGMVREDSPTTENIVQKKKKIKFADDAGGDLCHVKVFETDLESES